LCNFEWVLAFASTMHRTWIQPLTPTQCKIIAAYRTSNDKLAMESGWQLTIPISR
jgi:hypothetical protein